MSLVYLAPTVRQTRIALACGAGLLFGLAVVLPFAAYPVLRANGFIPAIDAVIFIADFITAALLWAHFSATRSRALWALGCGYLFSALVVVAHGVTFPGALSDTWLIGADLHINFRIYLLWHLGLPMGVFAYAWLKHRDRPPTSTPAPTNIVAISTIATLLSLSAVALFIAVLPPVAPVQGRWLTLVMMALCMTALWTLWRAERSALDQWLIVVLLAMIVEMAITSYVGGRGLQVKFATLGFYVGRLFMLLTSTVVLTALLSETTKLYAGVGRANLLATILRETHRLSHEIELPLLVDRLTKVALENAHADRALLLTPDGGDRFVVRAEARWIGGQIDVTMLDEAATESNCPRSLILSAERTRGMVDLNDRDADTFADDSYFSLHRPRSALCLPLVHQDMIIGLLYLENSVAPDVFTPERKQVLELLATQAAISLENAHLYAERVRSETTQRQLQADLAHVSRVATLNAMTASIGHEVSQPLSGVMTNASVGARMLAADPPDVAAAAAAVHRIMRDANRAAEVIQRLRDMFSKKLPSVEPVDLNDAAREVIALSSVELKRVNALVETDFTANLPLVRIDRVQVQQVVLNLLLNAADAMAEINDRPRHVVITTEVLEVGMVKLAVRDNGVGIDTSAIETLFQAFYTTKPQGMGVGLSICRSIIANHGGRLWAEGNDGPGATFCFSLPCAAISKRSVT